MIKLNKISFPTDFSRCANQALAHALYLAKQYQAELHMLHVTVSPVLVGDPRLLTPYTTDAEVSPGSLAEMASRHIAADLKMHQTDKAKIKQAHRHGISTAPEILQYAQENDIELIVMGTHGRRGLGHLFLGNVAEEVVRMARCPVLTIRERKEPMPVEAIKRILALCPVLTVKAFGKSLMHANLSWFFSDNGALRDAGQHPHDAKVRPPEIVENYKQ